MGQMLAPMLTGVESRLGSVQQGDALLDLSSLTSSLPAPAEAVPALDAAAAGPGVPGVTAADRPSTSSPAGAQPLCLLAQCNSCQAPLCVCLTCSHARRLVQVLQGLKHSVLQMRFTVQKRLHPYCSRQAAVLNMCRQKRPLRQQ